MQNILQSLFFASQYRLKDVMNCMYCIIKSSGHWAQRHLTLSFHQRKHSQASARLHFISNMLIHYYVAHI